ncbi:MAG: flagellar basal body-associated FliL family protein [Clostridia bacterium]|nr:flagellar basal body-associated FliL family protein [Clostridia bacterium]
MKKIIIMAAAILILTTITTILLLVVLPKKNIQALPEKTQEVIPEETEIPVFTYVLKDSIITNMKDSKRFVKASFLLEVTNEEDIATLTKYDYMIKDTIIRILRNTTEAEYALVDVQSTLREVIKTELMKVLGVNSIKEVFFLELVMQ